MRVGLTDNTNFQGKLVLASSFSAKPRQCINKTKSKIEQLVNQKGFNVYIRQDYTKSEINIASDYIYPFSNKNRIQKNISVTSKPSLYLDTVKENMAEYESYILHRNEENLAKQQRYADIKDCLKIIAYTPLMLLLMFADTLIPNGAEEMEKFINKIAKKFASKKG